MAVKPLIHYPNPLLKKTSTEVDTCNPDVRSLIENLIDTMFAEDSMGLAAPQIGYLKRIFVLNQKRIAGIESNNYQPDDILCFINPEIEFQEDLIDSSEGCLSLPGKREIVKRFNRIRTKAINSENQSFTLNAEGMVSILIQHEIDHLDGVLLVDKV